MVELRLLRDGGQTAAEVARAVAAFLDRAERSLELALYDLRLRGEAAELVTAALGRAHERGVAIRLVYNVDHGRPIPVPPPPQTETELLAQLPLELRAVPGVPDLMHHKYVVRDHAAVWTGSLNWTDDAWARQENVVVVVESEPLAHAYRLDFEQLWERQRVDGSGDVEPRPVEVDGIRVRPWFAPAHGDDLAHRIAKRIGNARRRVRIASPVLTSGPILGTLAEVCAERRSDVAGVVDDTQVDGVLEQWRRNGNSTWKVSVLRRLLESAAWSGKPSTRWTPDTVDDFMHAKVVVADEFAFVGSFNLSRSGQLNAEDVLELRDEGLADRLAAFVDEIRARYPPVSLPPL